MIEDPVRRQMVATYCDTHNPADLSILADHMTDDGRPDVRAWGEDIHRQIALAAISPAADHYHDIFLPRAECRQCKLIEECRAFRLNYPPEGREPMLRITYRIPMEVATRRRRDPIGASNVGPPSIARIMRDDRKHRLPMRYHWHLGVPASVRCEGQDFVSLARWLRDRVPLREIDLTSPPAVGVRYERWRRLVVVEVVGVEGARHEICDVDVDRVRGTSLRHLPDNEELIQSCIRNAFPKADVKIRLPSVDSPRTWSIMNFVMQWGQQRRGFLEYAPRWVDAGMEHLFAEYR